MNTTELLSAVAIALALMGVLIALMTNYRAVREARYNHELHRVELELMRKSLEGELYGVTKRLTATEPRWRDVNHLLLSSQERVEEAKPQSRVPLTRFLKAAGITEADTSVEDDLVFVLTPFHPLYEETYETISNVCREIGMRCLRGDEEYVQGDLLSHILRLIARSRLIIANIDGRNPNVFYELGLAHALDKTTVLVGQSQFDIPFDLRTKKLVLYDDQADLHQLLRKELARSLVRA